MPRAAWSAKRERQYDHIKTGLLQRGKAEDEAEEIAARTVNKVRAQEGESVEATKASLDDLSPSRRGGLRSHTGAKGRTNRQLYEEARAKGIAGRSAMNKAQLERALGSR
jgi:plasmid stabilization system protein ParE